MILTLPPASTPPEMASDVVFLLPFTGNHFSSAGLGALFFWESWSPWCVLYVRVFVDAVPLLTKIMKCIEAIVVQLLH